MSGRERRDIPIAKRIASQKHKMTKVHRRKK